MEKSDSRLAHIAGKLSAIGAVFAAAALIAIPILVFLQVLSRWAGFSIPGLIEYASYCFAAVSFLGLAYAMREHAHVRVSFLLSNSSKAWRRRIEIGCHAVGTVLIAYGLYVIVDGVYISWRFNDISQGHDATPLWIPQLTLIVGFFLLLLTTFARLVFLIAHDGSEIEFERALLDQED